MELTCPCGNGHLIRKVTTKGPNVTRPYYKCPGSNQGNNISDCKFYSFEDELKHCPCKRGFCRTVFRHKEKYWRCCVMGDDGCGFFESIKSTWQPPSSSTQSQSPQHSSSSQRARSNVMRKHELLVRSLEVTAAYLDLIKGFTDCGLED